MTLKDLQQQQFHALLVRVTNLEAENADLKSELEKIRTARTGSTWANTLSKSKVKPSVEMMSVVSAAKIELKEQEKKSSNMLVFGLPPPKAESIAKCIEATSNNIKKIFVAAGPDYAAKKYG